MYRCIHICLHTHIHIHTYLPTYVRTYVCTYVRTYVRTYIHTYMSLPLKPGPCSLALVLYTPGPESSQPDAPNEFQHKKRKTLTHLTQEPQALDVIHANS